MNSWANNIKSQRDYIVYCTYIGVYTPAYVMPSLHDSFFLFVSLPLCGKKKYKTAWIPAYAGTTRSVILSLVEGLDTIGGYTSSFASSGLCIFALE